MTELERVAARIARGDWTEVVRVASGETQTVYVIDGGTMRELRAALPDPAGLQEGTGICNCPCYPCAMRHHSGLVASVFNNADSKEGGQG